MRYARPLVSVFSVLGLTLIGVHLVPVLARAVDITDSQAGFIAGAIVTWAVFRIDALLPAAQPDPTQQD